MDLLNPGHTGSASQSKKPFKSRGTEKDVKPGQETRTSIIVSPTHPQVGPFCHNRPCMCVLGEKLGPVWWADESPGLRKGSCFNLFPQRTASFRPLRRMEGRFHTHSLTLATPLLPPSLALLPSKILTSFSDLLRILPDGAV